MELAERLADARAAYPGVTLSDTDFAAHLRDKLAARGDGAALRINELFLACAASRRDEAAIAHVERETFGEVEAAYRRFSDLGLTLDDVKQRLREKLFLTDPPAIAGYAGAGVLRGWVRAAALHMLLNISQRERREEPTDAALFDIVIGAEPNAEAAYVKLTCRGEFEAAFALAMSQLDAREKSLLRHAFVDGRSVDAIGEIYGGHRSTAARWVATARARLVERTRADLMRRLGVSDTEAHSIIAAALSGVGSMLIAKLG